MAGNKEESKDRRRKVNRLSSDLKKLEAEKLELAADTPVVQGNKVRRIRVRDTGNT